MSLDELLSFDTNEKVVGSTTIGLTKNNGLEEVEYIISAFKKVVE